MKNVTAFTNRICYEQYNIIKCKNLNEIIILTCIIGRDSVQISAKPSIITTENFCGFPQFLHVNAGAALLEILYSSVTYIIVSKIIFIITQSTQS
jgi:hypothetical protein